jgi:hypothetical protein
LQKAAEAVEHNLADAENNVTTQQMKTLESELSRAISELTPLVQEPKAHGEPLDTASALELLKKLEPILKDFDTECLSYTDKLRVIPDSADLILHIENLDFGAAEEALISLRSSLEKL